MPKSNIDLWANFLFNEKLDPQKMTDNWKLKLIDLCAQLALDGPPCIAMHKDKVDSRRYVCEVAMDMAIDLPAIKHLITKKYIIGRGLLDMWNIVYKERFGSTHGTQSEREAKRRDIKTKIINQIKS